MSNEFAELSERLHRLSALLRTTPFRAAGPLAERACLAVLARKYPDDLRRLAAELERPQELRAYGRRAGSRTDPTTVADQARRSARDEP